MTHVVVGAAIILLLVYGGLGCRFVIFSRVVLTAIALFVVFLWWKNTRGP
jgi:hypothetical protein